MAELIKDYAIDPDPVAEGDDLKAKHPVGNFPQACSSVALINTAHNLTRAFGPVQHRVVSGESTGLVQGSTGA